MASPTLLFNMNDNTGTSTNQQSQDSFYLHPNSRDYRQDSIDLFCDGDSQITRNISSSNSNRSSNEYYGSLKKSSSKKKVSFDENLFKVHLIPRDEPQTARIEFEQQKQQQNQYQEQIPIETTMKYSTLNPALLLATKKCFSSRVYRTTRPLKIIESDAQIVNDVKKNIRLSINKVMPKQSIETPQAVTLKKEYPIKSIHVNDSLQLKSIVFEPFTITPVVKQPAPQSAAQSTITYHYRIKNNIQQVVPKLNDSIKVTYPQQDELKTKTKEETNKSRQESKLETISQYFNNTFTLNPKKIKKPSNESQAQSQIEDNRFLTLKNYAMFMDKTSQRNSGRRSPSMDSKLNRTHSALPILFRTAYNSSNLSNYSNSSNGSNSTIINAIKPKSNSFKISPKTFNFNLNRAPSPCIKK